MDSSDNGTARTITTLSLIGFFGIFSTTISKNPVLPLFAHGLGAGDALLGVIAAVSPLAGMLFSFPVGHFSDVFGRKKLLVIAACFFLCAPLLYIAVNDPLLLIPVRFVHGMATAILGPVASAVICSSYPASRGEKLGLYSSVTLAGRTLAPLLGGLIITGFAAYGGLASCRLVYAAAFLLAIPVFILALYFKDAPGAACATKGPDLAGLAASFRGFVENRSLRSTALAEMAAYFSFGVIETYLPLYLSRAGVPAAGIGVIFSLQVLSIALTKPFFGRLADRIDKRFQILLGLACLGMSAAAIPLLSGSVPLALASVLFGVGLSFCTVATGSYTAGIARTGNLGSAMGALSSIMDIGHATGPFVTGFLITVLSLRAGFMFGALVTVCVAVYFAACAYRRVEG